MSGRRRSGTRLPHNGPARIGWQLGGESPFVIAIGHTQNPAEPRVPAEQDMTKGLDERVLAVHPLVEHRWRKPPCALDRRRPHLLEDIEGLLHTCNVGRSQLDALRMAAMQLVADRRSPQFG